MHLDIYSDGCLSHKYKSAGIGVVIVGPGFRLLYKTMIIGCPVNGAEIEYVAQFEALRLVESLFKDLTSLTVTFYTDNNQVISTLRGLMQTKGQHKLPKKMAPKYNQYKGILREFKSWEGQQVLARDNAHMKKADKLSKETMGRMKGVIIAGREAYREKKELEKASKS